MSQPVHKTDNRNNDQIMEAEIVAPVELVPMSTRAEMVHATTDNWMAVYQGDARNLAGDIANSDFMPKGLRGNPPAALAAILYGREIGLPPISTLQGLFSVDGRVGLYAEVQRALVLAAGHEYRITELSSARCRIEGRRAGQDDWQGFTFTMQEARDAGLANKTNWKNYAPDMLLARATARMVRAIFPDVTRGMPTAEEVQDLASATVVNTTTGEITELEPAQAKSVTRKPRAKADTPTGPAPERQRAALPAAKAAPQQDSARDREETPADSPAPATDDPRAPEPVDPDGPATQGQVGSIQAHMRRLGVDDREERLFWTGTLAGLEDPTALTSSNDLTSAQAATVLHKVGKLRDRAALDALGGDPS